MRQQTRPSKEPAEKVVQDIRRATRKHYSAEEKIRSCVAARGLHRTCTIAGRKTFWRLARSAWLAIQPGPPPRMRSTIFGVRPRRSRR
jgi:hypothetical protein